jgi:hypothetical protein
MTIKQAIKSIVKDWEKLRKDQQTGYSVPNIEAVWCGKSDTAGGYEVDEEWIGITEGGKIAWAYASGCSCWSGDFSEKRFASMKEVTLSHDHNTPEEWEKAIIDFAQSHKMIDMSNGKKRD